MIQRTIAVLARASVPLCQLLDRSKPATEVRNPSGPILSGVKALWYTLQGCHSAKHFNHAQLQGGAQ